jgi:hypothetical protein
MGEGKGMKRFALLIALLTLAGCASTSFESYEGRDTTRMGQGGTRKTVDGIDLWNNGDPPRLYKVIGYIDDSRMSGPLHIAMRDGEIAKKVREAGGDAAIFISSQSQLAGIVSSGSTSGYSFGNQASTYGAGFSSPASRSVSKYVVIKYVN